MSGTFLFLDKSKNPWKRKCFLLEQPDGNSFSKTDKKRGEKNSKPINEEEIFKTDKGGKKNN